MATRAKSTLRGSRRLEDRFAGRDQEGLPQARPRVPPGQEAGRQGGRGAVQGDPGRVRRSVGSREAQAVRRVRLRRRSSGRLSGRGRAGRRRQLRLRRHLRPLRRFRRHLRPRSWARTRQPRRGHPGPGQPVVRRLAARNRDADPRRGRACLPRVRRLGRAAGHVTDDLPRVQGARRHGREPGALRPLAYVPALRRRWDGDREAMPALPRQRP